MYRALPDKRTEFEGRCSVEDKGDSTLGKSRTILLEKLKESLASVLPITGIVFLLCFTVVPVPTDILMAFVVGAVLLILAALVLVWVTLVFHLYGFGMVY